MLLRRYQKRATTNSVVALKKHGNTILVAATGAGKTVMLSAITKEIIGKTKRALIIQHRSVLVNQNSKTFKKMYPDISIAFFNAQKKSWRGQVVFPMLQTLSRNSHLERMPPMDLIVYDEAHHAASESYRKITKKAKELNPDVAILGVTATPERGDKKGLKDTFNNVSEIITMGELIQSGHLVPPRGMVIDIGTQAALRCVSKTINDYNASEVEAIQNSKVLNNRIIEKWEEEAIDRPTVAFCATVKHAMDVRDAFRSAGYRAETISNKTTKKEGNRILSAYNNGEVQVLTNPLLLTEGWDCQICSCIMLLRISSHKSTVIQMVGRGLRTIDPNIHPGITKKDCKVLDFGISLLKHGNLESKVELKFNRKNQPTAIKECPMCRAELPINAPICAICGYEFKVTATTSMDEEFNELEEFRLIEIDLINNSPFRWISIFQSNKVLVTTGFGCWAVVVSKNNTDWYAIGSGQDKKTQILNISNKINAIASSDDFMRMNSTSTSAKKAARWMHEPISIKQKKLLQQIGCKNNENFSKVEGAAHITFRLNLKKIERLIEV